MTTPHDARPRRTPPGLACFLVTFAAYTWLAALLWQQADGHSGPLNWYASLIWSLPVLVSVLGLRGILRATGQQRPDAPSSPQAPVPELLIVVVPTVARQDTLVALQRVVRSLLRHLPPSFGHLRVDVVVEEGCECRRELDRLAASGPVRIVTVPSGYRTAAGSRFKARANHYAHELRVLEGEARDDVWILHMDDDTGVGADTVAALAGFIREQGAAGCAARHLAQGVLSFPRELSANRLLWLADAVRPGCDLSLFSATTGSGTPRIGLHGELLLVRASVESEIGWDFGPSAIVEDAQFALEFTARYPGRTGWFPARSYGVSPATVGDFLRQRERWSWGLLTLVSNPAVPFRRRTLLLALVGVWVTAPLQSPVFVGALALLLGAGSGPVSPILIPVWSLNIAYCVWLYWQGLKVNSDASREGERAWWEPVVLVLMLPLFSLWEATGAARGLARFLRREERTFSVIAKSA
ncbi:glycosyltransferase family 2 protein [Naasia sp. SYSU D00057]|uniref:glycosyltransferase family 2 protein n=1 Tax=Naasia sp. SYSU D00057 TaxID=2817380 RepID=UPI001B300C41|nr:glycosyltransferase family 2 protein [Naasia sp. SYSU D00057]